MHDVGDAVARAGLTEPVLDVDRIELTYPDVFALMRDLKAIGAHNVTAGTPRGLTGRRAWRACRPLTTRFRRRRPPAGDVRGDLRRRLGRGRPPAPAVQRGTREAHIAPGSIRRRGGQPP